MATGLLNQLGQDILPSVFSSLNAAGIVDTMTIKAETAASIGSGGERIKGTASDAYTGVPVSYEPTTAGKRVMQGDRNISEQQYTLTFPTHQNGTKITVNIATQRFVTDARGNEPAKTFRGLALQEVAGVVYELIAVKEN